MQERHVECDTLKNGHSGPIDLSCAKKPLSTWNSEENEISALSLTPSLKEDEEFSEPMSPNLSLGLNLSYNKVPRIDNHNYIPLSKIKKLSEEGDDSNGQNLTKRARLEMMVSNIFHNNKNRSPDSSTTRYPQDPDFRDKLCDSSDDNLTHQASCDPSPHSSPKRQRKTGSSLESIPEDLSKKHLKCDIKRENVNPMNGSHEEGVVNSRFLETILSNPNLTKNYLQREQEMFLQRMLQLQLSSAAFLSTNFNNNHPPEQQRLMKTLHQYPPWLYYGYYSQLMQNPWSAECNSPPNISCSESEGRKESTPSPTLSCGVASRHSDEVQGDANTRRRAPRALTGKHVRQGTGASPSTLMILRQTIQERQKLKKLKSELEISTKANKKGSKRKCR